MTSYPVPKHPRLSHYATPDMYFVTVRVRERLPLLGTVVDGKVLRTRCGGSWIERTRTAEGTRPAGHGGRPYVDP
jgi:hypothetical protein